MAQDAGACNQTVLANGGRVGFFAAVFNQTFFQTIFAMKTIISLVYASFFMLSFSTAQTAHSFHSSLSDVIVEQEEASLVATAELASPHPNRISNAWFPDFRQYVKENIKYPTAARESGLQGVVKVQATVRANGKLTDICIIEGLSYSCDREVERLLSKMPDWNPAHRNGQPIDQRVFVQVRFQLKPF